MKRAMCFLGVLALMFSTTACGPSGSSSATPSSSEGNGDSSSVLDPNFQAINTGAYTPLKFKTEDFNLEGRKIVIATWDNVFMPPTAGASTADDMRLAHRQKIKEQYGFDLEYKNINGNLYPEQVASALYSGTFFADIIYMKVPSSCNLMANDMFQPLEEYVNFYDESLRSRSDFGLFNGHYYGLPATTPSPFVIAYNPAMLESAGAEDPMDLYKAGNWNWDTMREIARKCTKDFNGDGQPDQYGLSSTAIRYLGFLNGVVGFGPKQNDKYVVDIFDEPFKNAMEYYQSYANEKLLDQNEKWGGYGANTQNFVNGSLAMFLIPPWETNSSIYANGFEDFSVVPAPMGPDVDPENPVVIDLWSSVALIPYNASVDVKQLLTIYFGLDYNDPDDPETYVDPDDNIIESYSSKNHWRTVEEILTYTEFQKKATNKVSYFNANDYFGAMYNMVESELYQQVFQGESVVAALDRIKDSIMAQVEELNKQ